MGRLTSIAEIKATGMIDWYLEYGGKYPEEDSALQLECAIDQRHFTTTERSRNAMKIEIRKFVEQCLHDVVIVDYLDISYYYWARPDEPQYLERQIFHGYYRFFFESEASLVQFKLRFSEFISEKLRWQDGQVPSGREKLSLVWEPPKDRY